MLHQHSSSRPTFEPGDEEVAGSGGPKRDEGLLQPHALELVAEGARSSRQSGVAGVAERQWEWEQHQEEELEYAKDEEEGELSCRSSGSTSRRRFYQKS